MRRLLLALALVVLATTARADDPKVLTKIAFGSCADQDKPLPIFDTIAAAKPDLLILLGDNMYADLDRKLKVTPDVIRDKYKLMEKVPGFAKLKATCPMVGTWDDHDYGKNDAGVEWEHKDEAQQALLDFFGVAKDDPRRTRKGVYHAEIYGPPGKRVQVILLDTRYFRSPIKKAPFDPKTRIAACLPNTDPDATFLGAEQWKWLEEQLKKPAEVRLLASSIQLVSDDHPFEKWANIPKEREKLHALLNSTKATGVIVLSGDRHLAEISLDTKSIGYPLYDVTSSGFNQGSKNWRAPEANSKRLAAMPFGDNFGFITIDWSGDDPRVAVQIRDEDGDATGGFKVRLSTLKGTGTGAATPVAEEKLPDGVLSPAAAAKKVGEKVTVQYTVASVGGKANLYLNTNKDFRAKDNFAVVLPTKVQTGKWEKAGADTFVGKTVRATGTIKLNKESPQLEVADPADLEIVEK
ncbi:Phosphodiesterase/alkaline phosphatase D OS=uncultured planctomycete GN=HGMM_F11F07C03 PE=4 SV=1: PhoD [Gemmataceae bacterium]|nr:Phosphodiesterase/alkaline phosphatase D OS=uncultured planctomycete GN=HGMM_F11F07C03 PE=4 SV=1: PhoD [Gemmataceae bacterium]VTU00768.1 Phosphodiesterase/alkaline phosphatase D OS=uncultured planctomycete GN=HGMM_F11F07C03 PE=4 SV=1: PhoD [Gemmataceae bacterium]